jgi:putative hydrolase of the HAD superfamily
MMPLGNDIEGLILDAVNTLIEPSPPVPLVYAEAARRQGLDLDAGEVKRRFERSFRVDESDERGGLLATDEATEHRRWRRIVADVLPDLPDPERAFAELWSHFGSASAWRMFADVGPAIVALREAGLNLIIASNFDSRLRTVVRGLPDLVAEEARLVISSEIGLRKPHPDFYRAACERLGLPPDRVLCVGDDVENDVLGPGRAGLRAILVDRKGRRPESVPHVPSLDVLVRNLL